MPTVRAALESMEANLFVGREDELDEFVRWFDASVTDRGILQVTGHAGIGKTSLLRAFARAASSRDHNRIAYVDGEAITATEGDFRSAVTGEEGIAPEEFFGDRGGLLILDGMEELAPLTRWLMSELIPLLDEDVRVVVAGRRPIEPRWTPKLAVRTMELGSLEKEPAADYLGRRGVAPDVAERILGAAGGYPLALTLAADLAVQRGVTRFEKLPDWSLALQAMVGDLLKDEPELQSLVEAAAVVRQFNEPILAAVAGLDAPDEAFAALCAMSFVRPTRHGLTLHDDVRRVVLEELGWRNPERLTHLRRRARSYYSDRIRQRRSGEEWLVAERMYLWEHTAHATYFPGGEPWSMWVEAGGPDDLDELLEIQEEFVAAIAAGSLLPVLPPTEECSPEVLRAIVSLPGTEVRIARSRDGRAHGYGFTLPVSEEAMAILPGDGAIATVIREGLAGHELPSGWKDATAFYLSAAAVHGDRAGEALGALSADWFRVVLEGGVFLVCNGDEMGGQVTEALGGQRITGVGVSSVGSERPIDGFVIDIGRIGPDAWLEAVTSGLPVPPALSDDELKDELHAILVDWPNDSRLASSPLAQLAQLLSPVEEGMSSSEHLRALVRRSMVEARDDKSDLEAACRAVEIAYFERKLSHEAIAERLHVSRTTFYRMLHRAEREILSRLVN